MTDQEINVAVAEWIGWKRTPEFDYVRMWPTYLTENVETWEKEPGNIKHADELPRYASDLNAIREAEENADQVAYVIQLDALLDFPKNVSYYGRQYRIALATARQRAEALLKTIGKWKE